MKIKKITGVFLLYLLITLLTLAACNDSSHLETPVVTYIEISGEESISIPTAEDEVVEVSYNAAVYDQDGEEMPQEEVEWRVDSEHVSLDEEGILRVTSDAVEEEITIKAISVTNSEIQGSIEVELIHDANPEEQFNFSLTPENETVEQGGEVILNIILTDENEEPVAGEEINLEIMSGANNENTYLDKTSTNTDINGEAEVVLKIADGEAAGDIEIKALSLELENTATVEVTQVAGSLSIVRPY